MFIFDAHLDLSMNAMEWNRDLRRPIHEIRARELQMKDKPDRGLNTVCFPEMRRGNIGLCVATLIGRFAKPGHPLSGWRSAEQCWAQLQGQLAWYRLMERQKQMAQIRTSAEMNAHLAAWSRDSTNTPVGYILSMECADGIVDVSFLLEFYQQGLRAIGPAHYGPGTYAYGTDSSAPLSPKGRDLLREMDRLKMILDATHLCDQAFWEALDLYQGPVWASHNNARAIVPHNRQYSDDQFKALFERGSVIGVAFDAWMLVPNWVRGQTTPASSGVSLQNVADQIDYICQLSGNDNHVGIGSDLDGAFGQEQSPGDLETIADLQKLVPILQKRGFSESSIEKVMHGNFVSFLSRALV
ncbi:MAG: peptidase [Verrucomicrobiales bacterium]|nr:peptidase [Verrucomicrobiales bacterium]